VRDKRHAAKKDSIDKTLTAGDLRRVDSALLLLSGLNEAQQLQFALDERAESSGA
jgi:hypothetical protein